MLKKLALLFALTLTATVSQASVLLSPVVGTLDLTILSDPGFTTISVFDIRNSALVSVDNPASVGGVIITDGTILGNPPPASPNSLLIMLNITTTEGALISFSNPRFGGSGVLLDATLAPLGGISDAALAVALAGGPYVFDFALTGAQTDTGSGVLSVLSFVGAEGQAVPEPATAALLGVGLIAGLLVKKGTQRRPRTGDRD